MRDRELLKIFKCFQDVISVQNERSPLKFFEFLPLHPPLRLQHLQSCLNLAFSTLDPISSRPNAPPIHKGYRVHVRMEKSWGQDKLPAPTLSFWCFIPGMAFRMLRHLGLKRCV